MIWGVASKEVYSSPQEISTAISLGVLQFNQGYSSTYSDLLPALGIGIEEQSEEGWRKIDQERVYQAEYRNSPEIKHRRKKKRKEKLKKQDAFIHQEGVMYKSQAFHGGKKTKNAKKGSKGKKSAKSSKK